MGVGGFNIWWDKVRASCLFRVEPVASNNGASVSKRELTAMIFFLSNVFKFNREVGNEFCLSLST